MLNSVKKISTSDLCLSTRGT